MRYLFVSYTYPGSLGIMASWLGNIPGNQVIFATSRSGTDHPIPNVNRVILKNNRGKSHDNPGYLDFWLQALMGAKSASESFTAVKNSGFIPDMIFGLSSNGALMGARAIFPHAFRVNFLERENFNSHKLATMRIGLQSLQIIESNLAYAFSEACRNLYPYELRPRVRLVPRMVDTDFFSPPPDGMSEDKSIVVVVSAGHEEMRDLELCIEILKMKKEARIALILGNSFGLRRLSQDERVVKNSPSLRLECRPKPGRMRDLFTSASLVVFPNGFYGLLEAMSCGAACMAAICPKDLSKYLLPLEGASPHSWAALIAATLADRQLLHEIGAKGARVISQKFGVNKVMPKLYTEIEEAWQKWRMK